MHRRMTVFSGYIGYFLIGAGGIIYAPSLPFFIEDFELSLGQAGYLFPFLSGGLLIGVLLGGILADLFGRRPLMLWGALLQAVGLALVASVSSWTVFLALYSLIGLGCGLLKPVINALMAGLNIKRRGQAINFLHGIYGLGALTGPLVAGWVLGSRFGWRYLYGGTGLIWLMYFGLAFFCEYPSTSAQNGVDHAIDYREILLSPIFGILLVVSFVYNGAATSLVGWINTYLDGIEFPVLLAAGMVSIFYCGLTAGRFFCGYISERRSFQWVIVFCAVGSLFAYPLPFLFHNPAVIAGGVFLAGFFFSGLYPTAVAMVNELFPEAGGTVSGLLSTSLSVGAMLVPWLTGLVGEYHGLESGLWLGFVLLVFLVLCICPRLVKVSGEDAAIEAQRKV